MHCSNADDTCSMDAAINVRSAFSRLLFVALF